MKAQKERDQEIHKLYDYQHGLCYICEESIDLTQPVDIDHIRSKDRGGININNRGLTHAACNRAKGNRDLDLQRYLARFQKARKTHVASGLGEDKFTVGVALNMHNGSERDTVGRIEKDSEGSELFITTWQVDGKTKTFRMPIQIDPNNNSVKSFTALVPIEHIFHDADINPRSIVDLEAFIEEFYRGNPQLLPSLAHLNMESGERVSGRGKILLFDGQHKAAAQVFLGNRELYLRVFINPDVKLIKSTNFGAHTKLAQIHFPTAIQDKVGHDIFRPALEEYLNSLKSKDGIKENSFFRSLTKEERSEIREHFKGYLKFRVVSAIGATNGRFFDYVETVSSRSKSKPLAYETVRKAFFNHFLCLNETNAPIDIALKMRDVERDNLARLLGLFTDKILKGQFDLSKGIYKIEDKLTTDSSIRDPHLRAYRLCRQAPLIVAMRELKQAISQLLSLRERYQDASWDDDQVLWADLTESDWSAIGKMLDVILSHKVWIERSPANSRVLQDNRQLSWDDILLRGTLPGAAEAVYEPLNHSVLLKHARV